MKKSILAAASVVALGISSFGVDAALTGALGPSSSSGQTTQWMGYGIPATPAQMARVRQEVAYYRKLAGQSQQRAELGTIREIGTTIRELEFPGG